MGRSNAWIDKALTTHPAETWAYEVLEELLPGRSEQALRLAEQRHIERLRSWMPKHGFNIHPAVWFGNTPGILGARVRHAARTRKRILRRTIEYRQAVAGAGLASTAAVANSASELRKPKTKVIKAGTGPDPPST